MEPDAGSAQTDTWCQACPDRSCPAKATVICVACTKSKSFFCDKCNKACHPSKLGAKHRRIDLARCSKLLEDMSGCDVDQGNVIQNLQAENLLCTIDHTESPPSLQLCHSAHTVLGVLKPDDPLCFVSVVGVTGSGKSLLLRSLIPPGRPAPLVSRAGAKQSMSHDVHVFAAGDSEENAFFLLDTEGTGGDEFPSTLKFVAEQFVNNKEFATRRMEIVHNAYPRLMYLFSNVMCFVFDNSMAVSNTRVQTLIDYANSGAVGSSNISSKPHLVIIFNKFDKLKCNVAAVDALKDLESVVEASAMTQLRTLYASINVLRIPDGSAHGNLTIYAQKMDDFRILISDLCKESTQNRKQGTAPWTKASVVDTLDLAISQFSRDPKSQFNLRELVLRTQAPPHKLGDHINEYFKAAFHHAKRTLTPGDAYDIARRETNDRVFDLYMLHFARRGNRVWDALDLGTSSCGILDEYAAVFEGSQQFIDGMRPCASVKQYGTQKVRCDSCKASHTSKQHQSSDTQVNQGRPCIWEGEFEPYGLESIPTLIQSLESSVKSVRKPDDRHEYLSVTRPTRVRGLAIKFESYITCVGCCMNTPTERIDCGHVVCLSCCMEAGHQCMLCAKPVTWRPSSLTKFTHSGDRKERFAEGFRVLSLDGGGIRGIVELVILESLQKILFGINPISMFEYVIGTSTGGIVTLALAGKGLSITDGINMYRNLGERAFVPRFGANWPILGLWLRYGVYGHKYERKNLHDELQKVLGDDRLLRSSNPKFAVTSCTTYSGDLNAVLFTSYNRPQGEQAGPPVRLVLDASLTEAAEATSAANTFFSNYILRGKTYIDGGMLNNNPCSVGYDEACRIFGEDAPCDLVLSLGTGFCRHEGLTINEKIMSVINMLTVVATDTNLPWDNLKQRISQAKHGSAGLYRINPTFDEPIALDDVSALPRAESDTRAFLSSDEGQKLLHSTALRLLSSSFYFVCRTRSLDASNSDRVRVHGAIKSRMALPRPLLEALKPIKNNIFIVKYDGKMLSSSAIIVGDGNLDDASAAKSIEIPIEFSCASSTKSVSIELAGQVFPTQPPAIGSAPISGFPRDVF